MTFYRDGLSPEEQLAADVSRLRQLRAKPAAPRSPSSAALLRQFMARRQDGGQDKLDAQDQLAADVALLRQLRLVPPKERPVRRASPVPVREPALVRRPKPPPVCQEDFLAPPHRDDAAGLLLGFQITLLANVIVRQLWHSSASHIQRVCHWPGCKFGTVKASAAWNNDTVQAVLEWRRVQLFGLPNPAHNRVSLEVYQQVLILLEGLPLAEAVGDLPQLWENLNQVAQTAGMRARGFDQLARDKVAAVAWLLADCAPRPEPWLSRP